VRLLSVVQGVGLTFAAAVTCAVFIGLAVAWTPSWDASDGLLKTVNVLAVAAGGLYAGRKAPRLGWLHGGASGLLYIVLVTSMIGPQYAVGQIFTTAWARDALLAFGAGAIGGMVGVAR